MGTSMTGIVWILLGLPLAQPAEASLPAFHNVRVEEDWSSLGANRRAGWERFKNVPLGPFRFSFGGQLRGRAEFWNDFGFAEANDDGFGLLRLRLHGDLALGPHLRLFVEGKSSLADGRSLPGGNRTLDTDSAALQHALLDVRFPLGDDSLTFRLGRQELQFGRQRLVSPLDWSNTRARAFDGFRGIVRKGAWRADAFWARFVRTRKYRFNPHDSGTDFFGVYAAGPLAPGWTLDAYWLGLDADSAAYLGSSGSEFRNTFGARLNRSAASWDLDLESALQVGRFAGQEVRAWMLAVQAGRSFEAAPLSPRLHIGFDYASGDGDSADGRLDTFDQLFPLGHAYLGYADFVGRQNIVDVSPGASLRLHPRLTWRIDQHWFWKATAEDALYNAGGGVVRPGAPGLPRRVGSELDLTLAWRLNRYATAGAGYTRFFAGPLLAATGPSQDLDFAYLQLQWTF